MARTEHVRFLVMVPNYWGIGDSPDDAIEELLAAGGTLTKGYALYEFPESTLFQGVHPVFGSFEFSNVDPERTEPPQPPLEIAVSAPVALHARRAAITRALVNDSIDEDDRLALRMEREGILADLEELDSSAI